MRGAARGVDPILGALNVERAAVVALLVVVRVLVVVAEQGAPVRIVVFHFRFSSAQDGRLLEARGGGFHDARPRSSPHASRMASARSTPSAMQVKAPASRSAAIQANCLSVARPPSALSSSAKQRPLWTANTSGTPGLTPSPFRIAASTGLR